jgi:hypothetical protein
MPSAMTTFLVAVSATSAVCYVLMTRMQNRSVRRASRGDTSSSDSGTSFSGDGWSLGSLFGHTSSDGSGHVTDSWGGSDCGGGDGGGDGGGGGD